MLRHDESDRPRLTRVVAEVARGWHRTGDQVLILGLDRGLRTLGLDGMAGDQLVRWNVEHGRPLPLVLLGILQTGWGVFYDGGIARFDDEDRDLGDARHEVGAGPAVRLPALQHGGRGPAGPELGSGRRRPRASPPSPAGFF